MAQAKRERTYTRQMVVRVEDSVWEQLNEIAKRMNTNPTSLVREWITERLRVEVEVVGTKQPRAVDAAIEQQMKSDLLNRLMEDMPSFLTQAYTYLRDKAEQEGRAEADAELAAEAKQAP